VIYDGAFSETFHATGALVIGLGWLAGLGVAVYFVLRRAVGRREQLRTGRAAPDIKFQWPWCSWTTA
jgi:hypothetical protein